MRENRVKRQIMIGSFLLSGLIATLFLPRMSIEGADYVDMVYEVCQYARETDEVRADAAGAEEFLTEYWSGGEMYHSLAASYDKKIARKTGDHPHISGLYLSRWVIHVSDELTFEGVQYKEGLSIKGSGVQRVFHGMGVLYLLPVLMSVAVLVFMLVKRRPYGVWLLLTGVVTVAAEMILYFAIPAFLWDRAGQYIQSFSLIPEGLLAIPGVGETAVDKIYHGCSGMAGGLSLLLGGLLILTGLLFLIDGRSQRVQAERRQTEAGTGYMRQGNTEGTMLSSAGELGMSHPLMGTLTGIQGEYQGQSIVITTGEEVVLGRDPAFCMLVFSGRDISRRHCGIRYDAGKRMYLVIDYSSTGTKLADGTMVRASSYMPVLPGTVIYLGSGREQLLLE